jgi:uncharacterized protein (DUF952 family)
MPVAMAQCEPVLPEFIYHIALPEHYAAALAAGVYTMSTRDVSMEREGYMHASFERQVAATLARYYSDVPSVCILVIDTHRVAGAGLKVVVEQLGASPEPFPHVYGALALPCDAIVRVRSAAEWDSGMH